MRTISYYTVLLLLDFLITLSSGHKFFMRFKHERIISGVSVFGIHEYTDRKTFHIDSKNLKKFFNTRVS